jgi:hypothetical protein
MPFNLFRKKKHLGISAMPPQGCNQKYHCNPGKPQEPVAPTQKESNLTSRSKAEEIASQRTNARTLTRQLTKPPALRHQTKPT